MYVAQSHALSRPRDEWGFVTRWSGLGEEVWRSDLGLKDILPDPIEEDTSITWGFGRVLAFTT